jgi:Spy/CpxP family protein refolding chaperone
MGERKRERQDFRETESTLRGMVTKRQIDTVKNSDQEIETETGGKQRTQIWT